MQREGIVRLITAIFICFSVVLYNFYGLVKPLYITDIGSNIESEPQETEEKEQAATENEASKEESTTSKSSEKSSNSSSSNTSDTSSVPVSAEDIKGQIISKYISPYTASLSYNKIYMKNSTGTDINIKKLFEAELPFSIEKNDQPQVLIVHTHATESFMATDSTYYTDSFSSRSRDNTKNMVKIGEIVAEKLNNAGISTLHDKTQHDYPEYTGSYTRAKDTINWYLKKYPTIKIVLDLHRDSVSSGESDKVKLVTEIEGKKAAQVMLVMGSQTGSVEGHENWQENLKLAFKLQQKLEENYPTLARPLMLVSKLYNQHLTKGSLLIEFGTDANSLEEACYSAELVGNALAQLLK